MIMILNQAVEVWNFKKCNMSLKAFLEETVNSYWRIESITITSFDDKHIADSAIVIFEEKYY